MAPLLLEVLEALEPLELTALALASPRPRPRVAVVVEVEVVEGKEEHLDPCQTDLIDWNLRCSHEVPLQMDSKSLQMDSKWSF